MDNRIGQVLARIRDAVNGPEGSLLAFTGPVAEVVHDFLSFRLTRRQASNILAVIFAYYAIKFPSPLDRTEGVNPVQQQIDHLISLASTITRDRHRYDLGSYSQLTYVGLLWAETALLMAKQSAKRSQGGGTFPAGLNGARYTWRRARCMTWSPLWTIRFPWPRSA